MSPFQPLFLDGTTASPPAGKAVCVGRNHLAHIRELDNAVPEEPVLFMKPADAFTPLEEPLPLPRGRGECHHEAELALLIGADLTRATETEARAAVIGYGLALDLTLRDLQTDLKAKGLPWERAKAFDASCPLSAFLPAAVVADPASLRFSLAVNGQMRQQGDAGLMITPPFRLVAHMSQFFTLRPGDVVLTGTPAGVAALLPEDRIDMMLNWDGEGQARFSARCI